MREYGQIQSAFWTSTDCAEYSDQGKLLAAYLMTGPHTTALGCFALGDGSVLDHLGWVPEKTEKGFEELSGNGFAYRFGRVVFLPKFLYWNKIQNGNIAKARFAEWEGLPKGPLKAFAARSMLEFCSHWIDEHASVLETVSQTVTGTVTQTLFSNSKTQNRTEQNLSEQNRTDISAKSSKVTKPKIHPVPEGFIDFWAAYPRKEAKGAAIKAYAKTTEAERRVIATVLSDFTGSWKWVNEPEYIPHPTTWLNQRRWEDTPPPKEPPRQAKPTTTAESRQARQLRVLEETTNDPRYSQTAQRQLATERHQARAAAPDHAQPALDASPGSFEWDPPGVD